MKILHSWSALNRPPIKVCDKTFPFDCAVQNKKKKQMVHVKMYIIANTTARGGEMIVVLKTGQNEHGRWYKTAEW